MPHPIRSLVLLTLVLALAGCVRRPDVAADEKAIADGEATWAASVASGDVAAIERLLGDDYQGVAPDGSRTDKRRELEETRLGPAHFASNRLVDVHIRFYGDTAVAQGSEHWELRDGERRTGRYVWSDTWVRRDGRWVVVAAADIAVPDPAPTATP
jgi:ketosteroid isomerase-like protein